jgi:thioredoxin-like negative regulator of GroEL
MALLEAGMTKAAFERTLVEAPVDVERGEDPMTALQRDDILPAFDAVREGATLELAQDRGLDLLKAFIDKQNEMERRSEIKKAMKPTEEEVLEQEREDAIKAVLNQAQREHYQHLGVIRIFAHFRPPYHAATLIDLVPRDTTVATMVETVAMSESQKQAEKEKEKKKKKKKQRQQRDQIRFGAAAFQQALAEAVESWEDGADRPDPVLTMEGLNNILSSRERYLVEQ